MSGYLRRLATTGAAYTASSVLSKLIAVAVLPLYTRHLTPSDFGAAELIMVAVIAASIAIRFGVIEALLRFYYRGGERPEAVVRTAFASLLWTTTAAAAVALAFAGPISEALIDRHDPGLARIGVLGLWVFTNYELVLVLFRLDERARAYLVTTTANVLLTIAVTIWLVVVEGRGADGLLLGNFGVSAGFLAVLVLAQRRRLALLPDFALLRRMVRFGLPTMPAELSLYSLNLIDRIVIVRLLGLAEAGLYALAIKFAQAITVLTRGFQLAWPPLAYSIREDSEAQRVYPAIVSWLAAGCAFGVVGLWLEARWIVRALAAPEFYASFEAVGLLAAGASLYALYLVLVVVLGRTGRTGFNFPAAFAATAVNVGLNFALVPPLGIAGAGLALVLSYLVVLALMYGFTQRLLPIPYEWGRLARVVLIAAGLIAAGDLLLPTEGLGGLAARTAVWLAFPLALWASGFVHPGERAALVAYARRSRAAL